MNLVRTFSVILSIGVLLYPEVGSQTVLGSHCGDLRVRLSNAFTNSLLSFFVSKEDDDSLPRPPYNFMNEARILTSRELKSDNSQVLKGMFSWHQVGNDINGEAPDDWSGYSVDISSDGNRVIIGADWNDGNGVKSGHARIFEEVNGTDWKQVGNDIDGEASGDRAGGSVGISSDGKRVIVGSYNNNGNGKHSGHARVFEEVDGRWGQLGEDIDGENAEDWSGESVDMSADGKRVIVGARFNDSNGDKSGHARVFQEIDGAWVQVGHDITGEEYDDKSGSVVSMSSDGKRVIVGAYANGGNGSNSGHARVFSEVDGVWLQIGDDIDGENAGDESGTSVDISADGKRVILGAPLNDGSGMVSSGHARVYEENDGKWIQVGNDIDGEAPDDRSGFSVSMSDNGKLVIIGAFNNDGNGDRSGHARVFVEVGKIWSQLGDDINGEKAGDISGSAVAMSSNGERVIIGAMFNDGNGTDSGHSRVFDLSDPSLEPNAFPSSVPSSSPSQAPSADAPKTSTFISFFIVCVLLASDIL